MKSTEIELTYLARLLPPEIKNVSPKKLVDIYIPQDSDFPLLRLRQKGDEYELTKKIPVKTGDYSSHEEHTITLTRDEYVALRKSSDRIVEKNRYAVMIDGYPAEVDVFTGKLSGLVMLDFEFQTEKDKEDFTAPSCCLADVTQEEFILGGQLAGRAYADIQTNLDKFNYKRLTTA